MAGMAKMPGMAMMARMARMAEIYPGLHVLLGEMVGRVLRLRKAPQPSPADSVIGAFSAYTAVNAPTTVQAATPVRT
jgi:hypothetical protein